MLALMVDIEEDPDWSNEDEYDDAEADRYLMSKKFTFLSQLCHSYPRALRSTDNLPSR